MSNEHVVIAGDGQMGLAMAAAAVEAGAARVEVWGPFEASVAELRRTRESPRLPGWRLPLGHRVGAQVTYCSNGL